MNLLEIAMIIKNKKNNYDCKFTLSTIHSSKGLEYDTVYIMDVKDGVFPEKVVANRKNATDEEIIEACKKASVHDFISKLPDGYDTNVGELGDMLSGGEKQRIGLAKAFYMTRHSCFLMSRQVIKSRQNKLAKCILKGQNILVLFH